MPTYLVLKDAFISFTLSTPVYMVITIILSACVTFWVLHPLARMREDYGGQAFIWPRNFKGGNGKKAGLMGHLGGPRGWVWEGDLSPPVRSPESSNVASRWGSLKTPTPHLRPYTSYVQRAIEFNYFLVQPKVNADTRI